MQNFLRAQTARWVGIITLISGTLAIGVTAFNVRLSTERETEAQLVAFAKAFRNEILAGEYKNAELQMRSLLHLKESESVKVLDPEFHELFEDGELRSWPKNLKQTHVQWVGFNRLVVVKPIYFDQEGQNLFGFIALTRSPIIDWTLLFSVLISLLLVQSLFVYLHQAGVTKVGSLLSEQLSALRNNFESHLKGDETQMKVAEIEAVRGAFAKVRDEIDSLKEGGDKNLRQIAHDIRSPLSALAISLQTLKEVPKPTKDLMNAAFLRMSAIAEEILTQNQKSESNGIDSQKLASSINSLLREKQATFPDRYFQEEIKLDARLEGLNVSELELMRVLSNLINNAVEASPKNTPVLLSVENDSSTLTIRICDQGPGMSEMQISKILKGEKFTTKSAGHGLGLSSARDFALKGKGSFSLSRDESLFVVELRLPLKG
jgi:signal transduction histidine kinase